MENSFFQKIWRIFWAPNAGREKITRQISRKKLILHVGKNKKLTLHNAFRFPWKSDPRRIWDILVSIDTKSNAKREDRTSIKTTWIAIETHCKRTLKRFLMWLRHARRCTHWSIPTPNRPEQRGSIGVVAALGWLCMQNDSITSFICQQCNKFL
jgi:hypothetical protein